MASSCMLTVLSSYCIDKVEDCGRILETETGVITSPDSDGDGHYDINVDCLWIIKASGSRIIRYRLIGLFLPASPTGACVYDVLLVSLNLQNILIDMGTKKVR